MKVHYTHHMQALTFVRNTAVHHFFSFFFSSFSLQICAQVFTKIQQKFPHLASSRHRCRWDCHNFLCHDYDAAGSSCLYTVSNSAPPQLPLPRLRCCRFLLSACCIVFGTTTTAFATTALPQGSPVCTEIVVCVWKLCFRRREICLG